MHGWSNVTKLKIGNFPLTGRGVYSTRNLKENDLVIEISTDALITINTIEKDAEFRVILRDILMPRSRKISSQCLFAIYILYLKHRRCYAAYMNSIPSSFTVPYFCTDDELRGMTSDIQEKVHAQQEIIMSTYQWLETGLQKTICNCCGKSFLPTIINLPLFEWAFFAVNSRSVYLDPDVFAQNFTIVDLLCDKPNMALAPFLDLLNHSSDVETALAVKRTQRSSPLYQLYTKNAIKRYEQIFISYGALDNIKLITEYGFSLPSNRFDMLQFRFVEIEGLFEPIPYKLKMFLKSHALDQHLNISRDHGFSHNFLLVFHLLDEVANDSTLIERDGRLRKLIYAEEATITSRIMNTYAVKAIQYQIQLFTERIGNFERLKTDGKLSDGALGYVFYLEDTFKWLNALMEMQGNDAN